MGVVMRTAVWTLAAIAVYYSSLAAANEPTGSEGPYFGQKAPSDQAELLMDGFISTSDEPQMNAAFTRDGRQFLFCARHQGSWAIFSSREENGRWREPEPLPFASEFDDRDFTMAPDGKTIYFGSNRPRVPDGSSLPNLDIYWMTAEVIEDLRP